MPLKDILRTDLKDAMKAHNEEVVGTLRLLIASISAKEIEKRRKTPDAVFTDEESLKALESEAKKRRESITIFESNARHDLADKEKIELAIIEKYLPAKMGEAEAQQVVAQIFARVAPKTLPEAMKVVMAELKGKADGAMLSSMVKKMLETASL